MKRKRGIPSTCEDICGATSVLMSTGGKDTGCKSGIRGRLSTYKERREGPSDEVKLVGA